MKNKDNLDSKKEKKVNKIKEQLARLREKLVSENNPSVPSNSKFKKIKVKPKQPKKEEIKVKPKEVKNKAKEAKEKKARRKEEAKKKAKEVKEKKARRKEEAKEEAKEKKELWGRSQNPPVECCKLLLDANIIRDIWNIHQARDRLRNYLKKKPFWGIDLLYLTLDRVIDEFIAERTRRTFGAEKYEYIEVCGLLSSLGTFQDFELDTRSEYARRAEELFNKKKYIGNDGKPIALVDCYLLEYAIEYSCKLVTRDKGLINATKKEIRLRSGESESTEGTSPGVFKPW